MSRARLVLGGVGTLAAAYGAWLVLSRGHDLLDLVLWLAAGVVLHDALLSGLVLAAGAVGLKVLPVVARGPVVAGAVVLGALTLLAIPVLGRFGERPDNATLLDRDYTAGWLVVAALTVATVAVATLVGSRRRRP